MYRQEQKKENNWFKIDQQKQTKARGKIIVLAVVGSKQTKASERKILSYS
jgi:hypothetical protein